jgi:hypothetical protein
MSDATYLFEKPSQIMKNSESRWTAVAQMSLIYISANMPGLKIPIYQSDEEGYLNVQGQLHVSDYTFLNTVCENPLRGEIFEIKDFNKHFDGLKIDIIRIDKKGRKVVLIEVKTLSESVRRNISLYEDLKKYLESCSWNCQLHYLLSHSHEKDSDWPLLSRHHSSIITWEDLFAVMAKTPLSYLIGEGLEEYCDQPEKRV